MTLAREPITRDEAYELERWLGMERFRRLQCHGEVVGWREPLWDAPTWLVMLERHRKEIFRAAVERLSETHRLMAASTAVTRSQIALLDLVDRAHESAPLASYIEGLLRLSGGAAVFSLIDERCRLDADLILRAEKERSNWRPPA